MCHDVHIMQVIVLISLVNAVVLVRGDWRERWQARHGCGIWIFGFWMRSQDINVLYLSFQKMAKIRNLLSLFHDFLLRTWLQRVLK